jgi:hypothetical protein
MATLFVRFESSIYVYITSSTTLKLLHMVLTLTCAETRR